MYFLSVCSIWTSSIRQFDYRDEYQQHNAERDCCSKWSVWPNNPYMLLNKSDHWSLPKINGPLLAAEPAPAPGEGGFASLFPTGYLLNIVVARHLLYQGLLFHRGNTRPAGDRCHRQCLTNMSHTKSHFS